jgi:SAM-dependent methyltransferase
MDDPSQRLDGLEKLVRQQAETIARLGARLGDLEKAVVRKSALEVPAQELGPRRRREAFDPTSVRALYSRRFSEHELAKKRAIWRALAPFFARRYPAGARSVLEIGAGEGEFLEHCGLERRVALDLNPSVAGLSRLGIEAIRGDATRLVEHVDDASFDLVFCSNVLEHFYDKDQVHLLFREVAHVLRPGGRFLVLQPNIRYVGPAYFDFIDHRLEFTEESIVEALELAGFDVVECLPRFLPYTTKSRLSAFYWLVPLYVRLPLAWRFFGKQCFIVAERPAAPPAR